MIFSTCLPLKADTAAHTARYVLPVPAGPMPNTTVFFLIASMYFFCPTVLHLICLPREVTATIPLSSCHAASMFPSFASSMQYMMRDLSGVSPPSIRCTSPSSTCRASSADSAAPEILISVPDTRHSTPNSREMSPIFSSNGPSSFCKFSALPASICVLFVSFSNFYSRTRAFAYPKFTERMRRYCVRTV